MPGDGDGAVVLQVSGEDGRCSHDFRRPAVAAVVRPGCVPGVVARLDPERRNHRAGRWAILAPSALVQVLASSSASAYQAPGRIELHFRVGLFQLVCVIAAITALRWGGALGESAALALSCLVAARFRLGILGISVRPVVRHFRCAIAAISACVVMLFLRRL